METRLSNMKRKVDTLVKSHDTLAQVLTRIEMQMNQQERQRVLYQVNHYQTLGTLVKLTWLKRII